MDISVLLPLSLAYIDYSSLTVTTVCLYNDPIILRVQHGYGKTCGVPKMGAAGTGVVLELPTCIDTVPLTMV